MLHLWKGFLQIFLVVTLLLAQEVRAADIYGNTTDAEVRSDVVLDSTTVNTMIVGGSGSPITDRAAVFVMQLPSLGAVANPFTSAIFRFHLVSKTGAPVNAHLYGLGSRSASTVLASDYYGQNAATDASDATLLQSDILSSATATGVISTKLTGSTALKNYLNAQYASGAGAGKYVFLRLSTMATPGGNNRYTVTAANGGAVAAAASRGAGLGARAQRHLRHRGGGSRAAAFARGCAGLVVSGAASTRARASVAFSVGQACAPSFGRCLVVHGLGTGLAR
jgi:hypothetical protein